MDFAHFLMTLQFCDMRCQYRSCQDLLKVITAGASCKGWAAEIGLQGKPKVRRGCTGHRDCWCSISTSQQHVVHEICRLQRTGIHQEREEAPYQMCTALLYLQQHHSYLQAEFESRCEMYEAQVTKMQRSMERSDTEKARVEEQLATAIAFNHSGDKQVYPHRQNQCTCNIHIDLVSLCSHDRRAQGITSDTSVPCTACHHANTYQQKCIIQPIVRGH